LNSLRIIKERSIFTLVIALILAMTFLLGNIPILYASGIPEITEKDQQEWRQVVEQFCHAWMNGEYGAMYQTLSKEGMGKMEKDKFIKTYKDSRVTECSIKDTTTKEDSILVKANLKFQKEIPPRIVSGLYTFNMIRDKQNWKIKYFLPPIKAPAMKTLPGGSHPGEQ
jgi:hypothetical protein